MTATGQDLTAMVHELAPFAELLGIDGVAGGPDEVRAHLTWT